MYSWVVRPIIALDAQFAARTSAAKGGEHMIQRISSRLQREDKGFTLIELMVVVLIIAILIAIAIPTFLGARRRAQDRAAQSSLRNTVTAAKTVFTDNESYCDATTCATPSVPAT